MALISLHQIKLSFGDPPLLDGVGFQVESGERICLLGRNGSGKSTLLKILAGEPIRFEGQAARSSGIKVSYLPQEVPAHLDGQVFDVVAQGLGESFAAMKSYEQASHRLAQGDSGALKNLEEAQRYLEQLGGWSMGQQIEKVLTQLGLNPLDQFKELSGGKRRRTLLARALVSEAQVLILDEPTNHLDLPSIAWLEDWLLTRGQTLIFVTHDRAFARRLATRVLELDRGKIYSFNCGYEEFWERKAAVLEAQDRANQEFDKKLVQEEAWVRRGVKARLHRNEGRVKALLKMREQRNQRRGDPGLAKIQISQAGRSGDLVAKVENLTFSWGEKPLIHNFSTTILRQDRIGILGPNGAGKTTLIRLLLGELKPQAGEVHLGAGLKVVYSDQLRDSLNQEQTIFEYLGQGFDTVEVQGRSRHVLAYMEDFLFSSDRAKTPVGVLSGGERNRLVLARLLTQPSNVLVLDEPTNDLDTQTLEILEALLQDYPGTVLLVSHDRDFLDEIITSSLVFTPEGGIQEVVGGIREALSFLEQPKPQRPLEKSSKPAGPKVSDKARKLTFKEEKELAGLPSQLEAWEEEKTALEAKLSDPRVYRDQPGEIQVIKAALENLSTQIQTGYVRWDELEKIKNPG